MGGAREAQDGNGVGRRERTQAQRQDHLRLRWLEDPASPQSSGPRAEDFRRSGQPTSRKHAEDLAQIVFFEPTTPKSRTHGFAGAQQTREVSDRMPSGDTRKVARPVAVGSRRPLTGG